MPDTHTRAADAFLQLLCFICCVSQPSRCRLVTLALALGRQKMKTLILLVIYSCNRIQWSLCWKITGGSHFCSLLCLLFLISIRRAKFLSLFLCSLYNFDLLHFPRMQDIVESGSGDLCVNLREENRSMGNSCLKIKISLSLSHIISVLYRSSFPCLLHPFCSVIYNPRPRWEEERSCVLFLCLNKLFFLYSTLLFNFFYYP